MTFLCMIAHRNKAVTKQDTGKTQQQHDQTSHCGAHVLTESTREWGICSSGDALKKSSLTLFLKK